jgi:uroporphyrinogen decarboxylase
VLPRNYLALAEDADQKDKTSIWGWKTTTVTYPAGGTYEELSHSPLAGNDDLRAIDRHPWPTAALQDYRNFPADIAAHKDRAIISASSWGAYFIATFLRGMEDVMMDFAANQKYADYLIGTIAERALDLLDHMLAAGGDGVDIVYMADDYCSQRGPLFDPQLFKRFVRPYLTKAVAKAHKHNKKFLLHVCGAVRPLLPMIIDCGVDMLEPIQIRAEGMDPAGLKRDFGKHLCFYGGVDLQQTLRLGTPQAVRDEVKRLIDILGQDGGYILGPGHTYIQVDCPLDNVLAMYETAQQYRVG